MYKETCSCGASMEVDGIAIPTGIVKANITDWRDNHRHVIVLATGCTIGVDSDADKVIQTQGTISQITS